MLKRALIAAAVATLCGSALGQLTYSQQNRSVTAIGPGGGTTSTQAATNFDRFSGSVGSQGPSGGLSLASQVSELLPLQLKAQGSAIRGRNAQNQIGQASSNFYVRFTPINNATFTDTLLGSFASGSISGPGVGITDVGDVHDVRDAARPLVRALLGSDLADRRLDPAAQQIRGEERPEVADVRVVVDRRAAAVEGDIGRVTGDKVFDTLCQGVVQAQRHRRSYQRRRIPTATSFAGRFEQIDLLVRCSRMGHQTSFPGS